MRTRQLFALLSAAIFVLAFSAVALAGGANCTSATKDASTASAACTKSATTTASAAGCSAAKLASAGSGCSSTMGAHSVAMETVRMPSGALAIFYRGNDEASVAKLQNGVAEKGAAFGCGLAGSVAANQNCKVEVANIENGIMLLVTSEKADELDAIEAQYAVAVEAHRAAEAGSGE